MARKQAVKRRSRAAERTRAERFLERLLKLPGDISSLLNTFEEVVKDVHRADKEYEATHWGRRPPHGLVVVDAADPRSGETFVVLGRLYAVTYETRKGKDRGPTLYEHVFSKTRPLLCYSQKQGGRLIIGGGTYKVTERGIEG